MSRSYEELKKEACSCGQGHVFDHYDTLNAEQQAELVNEIQVSRIFIFVTCGVAEMDPHLCRWGLHAPTNCLRVWRLIISMFAVAYTK